MSTSTTPPTERQLVELLRESIGATLPEGWQSRVDESARSSVDAVLELTSPDGRGPCSK